jgi:hypothetical protein
MHKHQHKKNKLITTEPHIPPADPNGFALSNLSVAGQETGKVKRRHALDKSLETVFRTCSTNNIRLSNMADNKAHILISINAIIISVLLAVLVKNIDRYDYLVSPVVLLLAISLMTIVFSMLATKPHLPQGEFGPSDVEQKKINLFFFGNYYRMDFDYFSSTFSRVTDDPAFLIQSLKRDIYEQGIVLSKKYRMLKVAYSVFMYGLIISVIFFFIQAKFH